MASILKVLTELTALSPNGIVVLKPFRSWFGIPEWRNRLVGIRLLNAKEIEQALEVINTYSDTSKEQALKREIVARALWSIDGAYVVPKEELEQYNKEHKTELSDLEYKRIFVGDFEQYVVDYLYNVYSELQQKQTRKIFGIYMCAVCRNTVSSPPPKENKIKFHTAEYICDSCKSTITENDMFDFEVQNNNFTNIENNSTNVDNNSTNVDNNSTNVDNNSKSNKIKTVADFESLEDYRNYLIEKATSNYEENEKI
jgi:hypothetical protein